jgi:hypothetical protein
MGKVDEAFVMKTFPATLFENLIFLEISLSISVVNIFLRFSRSSIILSFFVILFTKKLFIKLNILDNPKKY